MIHEVDGLCGNLLVLFRKSNVVFCVCLQQPYWLFVEYEASETRLY